MNKLTQGNHRGDYGSSPQKQPRLVWLFACLAIVVFSWINIHKEQLKEFHILPQDSIQPSAVQSPPKLTVVTDHGN